MKGGLLRRERTSTLSHYQLLPRTGQGKEVCHENGDSHSLVARPRQARRLEPWLGWVTTFPPPRNLGALGSSRQNRQLQSRQPRGLFTVFRLLPSRRDTKILASPGLTRPRLHLSRMASFQTAKPRPRSLSVASIDLKVVTLGLLSTSTANSTLKATASRLHLWSMAIIEALKLRTRCIFAGYSSKAFWTYLEGSSISVPQSSKPQLPSEPLQGFSFCLDHWASVPNRCPA